MSKPIKQLAGLLLILFLALPSHGAEKAGVTFPTTHMIGNEQLQLNGLALREKFIFDVYVAALYLKEPSSESDTILALDAPRMVSLHFLRNVGADKIIQAWDEGLEANVDPITPGLKTKFAQLADMMEDIEEGQVMTFTYTPQHGTVVVVAGQHKGTIEGKDFADAILSTWIGPNPGPGKKFKSELLGQE